MTELDVLVARLELYRYEIELYRLRVRQLAEQAAALRRRYFSAS